MKRWWMAGSLALGIVVMCVVAASSQPRDGDDDGPKGKDKKKPGKFGKRPPPKGDDDDDDRPPPPRGNGKGPRGKEGAKGFQIHVFPPHLLDELDLTADQEKKLKALEKEFREKVNKILTAGQKKKLENHRPPRFRQPPPRGGDDDDDGPPPPPRGKGKGDKKGPPRKGPRGGDDDDDAPPPPPRGKGKGDRKAPPPREKDEDSTASIQWYPTLKSGLEAAKKSGKPVLFVSAAPHCAGVSGIW